MNNILLSIITINFNNKTGLEKTIESVTNQSYSDFEYIIIDGASEDGSLDIIKKYQEKISWWISEKDNGIYNAMNKGILKAKGEYCLFINSGDVFTRSTILDEMVGYINGEDILYGNGYFMAGNNSLDKLECPSKLTLGFFCLYSLFHPATLIKRSLFDKFGLYNESNKIISDWEFFLKTTILENVKTKLIPIEIAFAEDRGISRRSDNRFLIENEKKSVLNKYLPSYVIDLMSDYKEMSIRSMKIEYEKNNLQNEMQLYKRNLIFRAALKAMRLVSRIFYK